MVAKMQENICSLFSHTSLAWDIRYKEGDTSPDELFVTQDLQEASMNDQKEWTLDTYEIEAAEGISQIQDPLWRRVCVDVLRILGPVAFKNLWKIKLCHVSAEGRKAYFISPTMDIAETIENYNFVIIEALKKFYPSLLFLETKVIETIGQNKKNLRTKVSFQQHVS
ncbi:MAG: hypothetical protein K2W92_00465 [Alphaproteobacteria bacterium]|nr:hypothetical protein [Alphaproteobacteria bacterium]